MADYIEIDTTALNRDRQTIQSELERVRTKINQLREKMVNLGTMWEGPAHNAFMSQFHTDYEFVQEFAGEIKAYLETMEYAEREYERCEDAVRQAVDSIRV